MRISIAVISALLLCMLVGCAKTDVTGKWQGTLTKENGRTLDVGLILAQKETSVTGVLGFTKIGGQIPVSGTAEKGKVSLSSDPQGALYLRFTGDASGQTIKGPADVVMRIPNAGTRQEKMQLSITKQ